MQLRGDWQDALEEARRAHERFSELDQRAAARALYRQAEVHRLRGEFDEAEEEYRKTSEAGCEPQPGLAQLRMAQGHADAAAAMIGRVLDATRGRLQRTKFLPACIEIMLAAGDIERSRDASRELKEIAKRFDTDVLRALAAQGRGAVTLAEGDARAALGSLRVALETWRQVEAPYEVARVRVLTGLACRGVGDDEGARLEFDAAKGMFKQLGAWPDVARIDALTQRGSAHSAGLTSREFQVLRLVAAGKTNKFIAAELSLSEKTVERHVSNVLTKLDVDSRTAAAAYAYEHKLFRPD
jgi:ATP/maltotriose-dependent transcriptional regulator MalT